MGFSETFFEVTRAARKPTLALVSVMDPTACARPWLLMLFHIIQATDSLLRHGAKWADFVGDTALADFYRNKSEEEGGHDFMLLGDLGAAGIAHDRNTPVNPHLAEMVGRQFYLVEFVHPAAYLGFMGLLEGFPPTLEQIETLQRASGLPVAAFATARLHARADVKHREELAGVLDVVPAQQRAAILANAIRCAELQFRALESLPHAPIPEEAWTPTR